LNAFIGEGGSLPVIQGALDSDSGQGGIEDFVVGERAYQLAVETTRTLIEVDQDFWIILVGMWHESGNGPRA